MKNEYIIEEMAKAGYETMFDDTWNDLSADSIEKVLWHNIAKAMLKSVRFPRELPLLCRDLLLGKEVE